MATTQVIMGGNASVALNTTGTVYSSVMGTKIWDSIEDDIIQVVPAKGTFTDFRVHLDTAPGVGNNYTFTFRTNSSDTNLETVLSDSETDDVNSTNSASVVFGDDVSVKVVANSKPSAAKASYSFRFTPDTADETICMATSGAQTITNNATSYIAAMGEFIPKATDAGVHQISPIDGTLKNLVVKTDAAMAAGEQVVFTIRNEGARTAVTTTLTEGELSDNDTANTATVSATNLINTQAVSTNFEGAVKTSFVIVPDTTGQFPFMMHTEDTTPLARTLYNFVVTGNSIWATESNRNAVANFHVMKQQFVWVSGAAGGGANRYDFTLMGGGTASALSTRIAGKTETEDNNINDVSIPNGALIDTQIAPNSLPSQVTSSISYLALLTPTSDSAPAEAHQAGFMTTNTGWWGP